MYLLRAKHPSWTRCVRRPSGTVALFKQRRMALIADAVSANIYVRRAGHPSDGIADNGNKAKLLQWCASRSNRNCYAGRGGHRGDTEGDTEGDRHWSAPELKGCQSQGATIEDALANIREAIELYLETLPDDERDALKACA